MIRLLLLLGLALPCLAADVEIEGGNHDAPVKQVDWSAALDFISRTRGEKRSPASPQREP